MKPNPVIESQVKTDLKSSPAHQPYPENGDQREDRPTMPLDETSLGDPETPLQTEAAAKPASHNWRQWLLAAMGIIALVTGVKAGWQWWQFQHTHVTTDNAQIEGHISAIAPKIAATVQQVRVKNGDFVKAGQLIVILEDEDLQLKVNEAEANLRVANAQLKSATDTVSLTANTNITQVQQAESNLQAQEAAIRGEQTNVKQAELGVQAAAAQLQQAALGVNSAAAQLQQALAGVAAQRAKVQAAELGVNAARAKVSQAETEVTRTHTDFQRYESLYQQGVITSQQRDAAFAAFQNATASLTVAQEGVGQAQAQVKDAQSQLQQAQAQVNTTQAQLQQAHAQVDSLQSRLQQAQSQVKNTLTQVQKSIAEAEASKAQVAETKAATQKVVVQQDQTQTAQAQVKQAQAALALVRQQLEYTMIKAPISGYVGQVTAEVGQKIQPGQPLLAVVPLQTDEIYVEANFKETELKDLRVGEPAEVKVDAYPGEVFRAQVAGISPATGSQFALLPPDNATGNFNKVVQWVPVRLTFLPDADPQHKLRAGLSITVSVNTKAARE